MRSYPLYIDGRDHPAQGWIYCVRANAFLDDPSGAFRHKRGLELGEIDPALAGDAVYGRCARGGEEENELALVAARSASRIWGATPLALRRQVGAEIYAALRERAEELVEILVAEGHPRRLARWEVRGVLQGSSPPSMDWNFKQLSEDLEDADGCSLRLVRKPDGVVCVSPPQNAAGSNSALGIGALLAGNAVVVKAPRTSPVSVMFLYREIVAPILERAGAPPGTLNIIGGHTSRMLRQWVDSPHVDDIMFFGDSDVGLTLGADCIAKGKKPVLELSGNDGCVVWRDADLDGAARAVCECFYGSGQICMVPKYVLVHPAVADALIERVLERVREIRPGYPDDDDVPLSPVLKTGQFFDFLAEAVRAGAEMLSGGRRVGVDGEPSAQGLFLEPTVLRVDGLEQAAELRCVAQETFFPLLPIVVAGDDATDAVLLDRMIAFVNANEYGLRNSLWSSGEDVIAAYTTRVTNGGLLKVNCSHIEFVAVLATHGGTGRTGGPSGELNYPVLRTSHLQGITVGPPTTPTAALARAGARPATLV